MILYVDGSWKTSSPNYSGWGFILVDKNEIIYEKSGYIECYSRQIDGELYAVLEGLKYIKSIGLKNIEIIYDYIGIEKWAKNEWKAKSLVALEYIERLKEFSNINIKFTKIKSHSGLCEWNDYVDNLAKNSLKKI